MPADDRKDGETKSGLENEHGGRLCSIDSAEPTQRAPLVPEEIDASPLQNGSTDAPPVPECVEGQGPIGLVNWLRSRLAEPQGAYEVLLYSDRSICGEAIGLGPYDFLNLVPPHDAPMSAPEPVAALRIRIHLEPSSPSYERTSVQGFHGGWVEHEVSALLSLASGARFKSGACIRTFGFHSTDPHGRPSAESARPVGRFQRENGWRLRPPAPERINVSAMRALLESYASLRPQIAMAIARAALSYQEAIWVSETDPARAWLLLVSAAEVAAVTYAHGRYEHVAVLREQRPAVAALLEAKGLDHLEAVAAELAPKMKVTSRFLGFLIDNLPDPPQRRPSGSCLDWAPMAMKKTLNAVYGHRSKYLHEAVPIPAPMCEALHPSEWWPAVGGEGAAPEEQFSALASSTLGGVWVRKDLPMRFHMFEHVVRGALLNWWRAAAGVGDEDAG